MTDPFSTNDEIIRISGEEMIRKQKKNSIDCCFGLFCLHFMSDDLQNTLKDRLTTTGVGLFFNVSSKSPLFGNKEFNQLFFKHGYEKPGSKCKSNSKTFYESITVW